MGNIYTIGDIHGCASKLSGMMEKIDINPVNDTLVFIGDYIDRGPDSKGVIEYILELKKSIKNVISLLGNHESMFLNFYCHSRDEMLFLENGGRETLLSYGDPGFWYEKKIKIPKSHIIFFESLKPYFETDDYIFVHAGLKPGIALEKQDLDDMIWIRGEFIHSTYDFGKTVVFGHTPLNKPLFDSRKIGIDTGAVYGGRLTCVKLPDMDIYQV